MKLVGMLFVRRNPDKSTTAHVKGASGNVRIATPAKAVLQALGNPSRCKPVDGIPGVSWSFGSVECEVDPNTRSATGLKRWIDPASAEVSDWLDGLDAGSAPAPVPAPQAPAEPAPSRT